MHHGVNYSPFKKTLYYLINQKFLSIKQKQNIYIIGINKFLFFTFLLQTICKNTNQTRHNFQNNNHNYEDTYFDNETITATDSTGHLKCTQLQTWSNSKHQFRTPLRSILSCTYTLLSNQWRTDPVRLATWCFRRPGGRCIPQLHKTNVIL